MSVFTPTAFSFKSASYDPRFHLLFLFSFIRHPIPAGRGQVPNIPIQAYSPQHTYLSYIHYRHALYHLRIPRLYLLLPHPTQFKILFGFKIQGYDYYHSTDRRRRTPAYPSIHGIWKEIRNLRISCKKACTLHVAMTSTL